MESVAVGKAKITVDAKGCIECGTEHATGWDIARTIPVVVGGRRLFVEVNVCSDCARKTAGLLKDGGRADASR